jgi:hypothetical protein
MSCKVMAMNGPMASNGHSWAVRQVRFEELRRADRGLDFRSEASAPNAHFSRR